MHLARALTTQIAGTSTLIRNIARGLAPVEVDEQGLVHALRKLVLTMEGIYEVPCTFLEAGDVVIKSEVLATHLYRIAQEFMSNAARHANPRQIEVTLERDGTRIKLTVTNDGVPFERPPSGYEGIGLKIVRYRARIIDAAIDIRARSDGTSGTIAECVVTAEVWPLTVEAGPAPRG